MPLRHHIRLVGDVLLGALDGAAKVLVPGFYGTPSDTYDLPRDAAIAEQDALREQLASATKERDSATRANQMLADLNTNLIDEILAAQARIDTLVASEARAVAGERDAREALAKFADLGEIYVGEWRHGATWGSHGIATTEAELHSLRMWADALPGFRRITTYFRRKEP